MNQRSVVVDRQQIIDHLRRLPVEELVAVLRDVFDARQPYPEEAAFCRNRFFLGIASCRLESDEGEPERWGRWVIEAVAYPGLQDYGGALGPDSGLCQSGVCLGCGAAACSNVKNGICSVCGASVNMT